MKTEFKEYEITISDEDGIVFSITHTVEQNKNRLHRKPITKIGNMNMQTVDGIPMVTWDEENDK